MRLKNPTTVETSPSENVAAQISPEINQQLSQQLERARLQIYEILFHVVTSGDCAVLEHLISNGVNIEMPDDNGHPPMVWAARHQQIEVIELLLQYGASISKDQLALLDTDVRKLILDTTVKFEQAKLDEHANTSEETQEKPKFIAKTNPEPTVSLSKELIEESTHSTDIMMTEISTSNSTPLSHDLGGVTKLNQKQHTVIKKLQQTQQPSSQHSSDKTKQELQKKLDLAIERTRDKRSQKALIACSQKPKINRKQQQYRVKQEFRKHKQPKQTKSTNNIIHQPQKYNG